MTAIRLGVIGAGIMGERMLRAALDHAADTVQIVGVWDPSAAARARTGRAAETLRALRHRCAQLARKGDVDAAAAAQRRLSAFLDGHAAALLRDRARPCDPTEEDVLQARA